MIETVKKKEDLTRLFVSTWAILHVKRKAIHEDIFQSPLDTMSFVNRFLEDLGASKDKVGVAGGRAKEKLAKRWIAPPEGKTKINDDAAVAKSIPKGAVVVVCHHRRGLSSAPRLWSLKAPLT
jgi:hypothetical protein